MFSCDQAGGIRVVVPDLEQIARLYLATLAQATQGDEKAQQRYEWTRLEMFDQMSRDYPGGEMFKYWKQNPRPAEDIVIERLGSEVLSALATLRSSSDMNFRPAPETNLNLETQLDPIRIDYFRLSKKTPMDV